MMKQNSLEKYDVIVKQTPKILELADDVEFGNSVFINVTKKLVIKSGSKIRDFCRIEGRDITIGENFVMNHHAEIGGGACFEDESKLTIGNNCHLGSFSIINTTKEVKIGDEVGMGRFTNLYTHGAWLSPLEGFPSSFGEITIGNKVWIPSATILPNTDIGNNVVISEGAKIQGIVPSGCHVTKSGNVIANSYPKRLDKKEIKEIILEILENSKTKFSLFDDETIELHNCLFNIFEMRIRGEVSVESEKLRTHLRRHGIRFLSRPKGEKYV